MNEALIENANIVVTDNLITAVSTEPLAIAGGDAGHDRRALAHLPREPDVGMEIREQVS